jgi:hypothetical protein
MQPVGALPERESSFKRVLFIGAGFSAGMCYPVGNTLTVRLTEYLEGSGRVLGIADGDFENSLASREVAPQREAIRKVLTDFLAKYFAVGRRSIGDVGVAEFFTMAHSLAETPSLFGLEDGGTDLEDLSEDGQPLHIRCLFNLLACITRTYFIDIFRAVERRRRPTDVVELLGSVDPGRDAIVNFNWDEEVDVYFTRSPEGEAAYTRAAWQSPTKEEKCFLLLRPHGSVGWYDITSGIANNSSYLIAEHDRRIARSQKRILSYSAVEWPIDLGSGRPFSKLACPPVITPPTFAKRFQYKEQHRIWSDVLEVCSRAKEFVFVGYSMPRDDYLTRAAICSSLANIPCTCLPGLTCLGSTRWRRAGHGFV